MPEQAKPTFEIACALQESGVMSARHFHELFPAKPRPDLVRVVRLVDPAVVLRWGRAA